VWVGCGGGGGGGGGEGGGERVRTGPTLLRNDEEKERGGKGKKNAGMKLGDV